MATRLRNCSAEDDQVFVVAAKLLGVGLDGADEFDSGNREGRVGGHVLEKMPAVHGHGFLSLSRWDPSSSELDDGISFAYSASGVKPLVSAIFLPPGIRRRESSKVPKTEGNQADLEKGRAAHMA
jgi:hypothetical protein